MNEKATLVETGFDASFSTNKRNDDMKKSLFMTAVLVAALVGCSKSNSSRMGGPATRESETVTSSTADTTSVRAEPMDVTKDVGDKSGSGSISEGLSGAAAGSVDTARTTAPTSQGQDNPNTTGDRSDGDLSNRPAGAPALGDQGSASSTNTPSQNDNSGNTQSPDQSQQQRDQQQQTPQK
jgi:hypothetical protein